jgi:hypothetical protein
MNKNSKNEIEQMILGVLEVIGIDFLLMFFVVTIPFIGLVQFIYIIPRVIYLLKHGEAEVLKGVIIASAGIFLLNGGCWALIF